MEAKLRPIYQERASHPNTLGIVLIEKKDIVSPVTDTFDVILFVILKQAEEDVFIKHYSFDEKKAALHLVTEKQVLEWLLLGSNRKIIDWLMNGKIVFDRNEYIEKLKTELNEFPFHGRKLKMGIEFARLIRRYRDGKSFFESHQYLDAYNHIVHSLHHLARLAVIDHGFHPEVTVWNQVKKIEPEIYKLYEELVMSEETMEKRLELLFLASELLILQKVEQGSAHLFGVLEEKDSWSIQELLKHEEVKSYGIDLTGMLEFLIEKHQVHIQLEETKGVGIYHRYYAKKNF
ncbi:nucleotidyltransferase-like protein [Mangrovibacillus cuniculi]|uniref:Nucleotidyltransferase-like domain-containing protein n=1 Tax=Mangrovibacillus cuniculi TaxID=2593652 RepID=A0A7S8HEJ4_9BACI|nr:nucleotidyltransferase-like protein [Mangrovibacillus cuniculi]QPC45803.1 hypothetical protein G8O30_01850 [Mangrovibacillus cuniculi]